MAQRQECLPFGEAEGTYKERAYLLTLALTVAKADLALTVLMRNVFHATAGGVAGSYKKSYEELGATPDGLCCSPKTAKRVVLKAEELGWLTVTPTQFASGGYSANEYEISWDGVRATLQIERGKMPTRRPAALPKAPATSAPKLPCSPPAETGQIDHSYGHSDPGYGQNDHSIKDSSSLSNFSSEEEEEEASAVATETESHEPSLVLVRTMQERPQSVEWQAAEAALGRAGVKFVPATVEHARRRNLGPADVLAICREFAILRPTLKGTDDDAAGAIVTRIREGAWPRGKAPKADDGDPSTVAARRMLREDETRRQQLQFAQAKAQAEADARRLAILEKRHGAEVNAAADDDLAAALEAYGMANVVPMYRRLANFGRASPTYRGQLLEAWALKCGESVGAR